MAPRKPGESTGSGTQAGSDATVPAGDWTAHIGHKLYPHYHAPVGKVRKPCSGRWYCQQDKTWITWRKCDDPNPGAHAAESEESQQRDLTS